MVQSAHVGRLSAPTEIAMRPDSWNVADEGPQRGFRCLGPLNGRHEPRQGNGAPANQEVIEAPGPAPPSE